MRRRPLLCECVCVLLVQAAASARFVGAGMGEPASEAAPAYKVQSPVATSVAYGAGGNALAAPLAAEVPLTRRVLGGELTVPERPASVVWYFWHLPLVSCPSYTQLEALYTLSVSECASRCSDLRADIVAADVNAQANGQASPRTCNSFMYARYDSAPPTGMPPAPAGQAWSRCVLMEMTEAQLSSCSPKASPRASVVPGRTVDWFGVDMQARDTFDTYVKWLRPAAAGPSDWVEGRLTVGGLTAAQLQLQPRSPLVDPFNNAVTQALQNRCCACFVELVDVADVKQAKPAALVRFRARMLAGATGVIPFMQSKLVEVLTSAEGEAALLAALLAHGVNATNVTVSGPARAAVVCPAPEPSSHIDLPLLRGFVNALTVCVVLLTTALVLALYRGRERTAEAAQQRIACARIRLHDVVISFGRQDLQIADSVHDKLQLAGLRVLYDRGGGMAERPLQKEVMTPVRDAPLFAVIVSLESLRLWAAHRPDKADEALAEFVLASHLMRRGVVRRIFPLLVGAWQERASGGGERDYLPGNAQFQELCAQLPAVVPTATLVLAASMLEDERGGETLDACFQGATVRDILLGPTTAHGARAFTGLLQIHGVALDGPQEQEGLVLRHRYAESMMAVLREP